MSPSLNPRYIPAGVAAAALLSNFQGTGDLLITDSASVAAARTINETDVQRACTRVYAACCTLYFVDEGKNARVCCIERETSLSCCFHPRLDGELPEMTAWCCPANSACKFFSASLARGRALSSPKNSPRL